nr:rRNA (cytidine-2'-O-)-methyltransferase [Bacillota bacterium]
DRLKGATDTLLFYEAPHRLAETLEALLDVLGDRRAVLARELTKVHEEIVRGSLTEILALVRAEGIRGECTLVVEGAGEEGEAAPEDVWWEGLSVADHVAAYEARGFSRKEAMKAVARDRGVSKREVYAALLEE